MRIFPIGYVLSSLVISNIGSGFGRYQKLRGAGG